MRNTILEPYITAIDDLCQFSPVLGIRYLVALVRRPKPTGRHSRIFGRSDHIRIHYEVNTATLAGMVEIIMAGQLEPA